MLPATPRRSLAMAALLALAALSPGAQAARKPLTPADVDAIVQLVTLEDTRQFDEPALTRLLRSTHPEVRRRAVVSVARIGTAGGRALLSELRRDPDPEIVATVAFAYGQLKDPGAVGWLGEVLSPAASPAPVAFEAARALGKIRTPEARIALAQFLTSVPFGAASPAVGEALLSLGRFTTRDEIAPIVRWTSAADGEVRWRAAWALFRLRHPGGVPHLLKLADDTSPVVRFWALRGLVPATLKDAGVDPGSVAARLRDAIRDPDRQVRTEALRALVLYDDDASLAAAMAALDSNDTWLSVSAAEQMDRLPSRASIVVPRLVAAGAVTRPLALRITALEHLPALSPEAAADLGYALAREKSSVARGVAMQVLAKLGPVGRGKLEALAQEGITPEASGGGRGAPIKRSDADYRRIVERWIVADYNGAAPPRAVLATTRGEFEIELHPGDAPLAVEHFVSLVESGNIIGTEFGRLVPNFVAQQRPIRNAARLRDEVSRRGLTRGNVSWASAGLDTGTPGFTFGITPQPHNEGDFTALGQIVRGLDTVERIERGDAIVSARILK